MINFKNSDFCKLLRLCAISASQISKKHFATFDFFVKMKLVSTKRHYPNLVTVGLIMGFKWDCTKDLFPLCQAHTRAFQMLITRMMRYYTTSWTTRNFIFSKTNKVLNFFSRFFTLRFFLWRLQTCKDYDRYLWPFLGFWTISLPYTRVTHCLPLA